MPAKRTDRVGALLKSALAELILREVKDPRVRMVTVTGVDLSPDFADQRLAFADTLPPGMTSSMHNDLERGNRLEVGWLSGAVVRLGRDAGIPTPANRAVYAALKLHAGGSAHAG